jgi:hypothetical protein
MPTIDLTQILLQNGISSLFVVVIIAYLYFQSKKKAETLVIKDEGRKEDTDKVARDLEYRDRLKLQRVEDKETELERNHLAHQEAIEIWMRKMTCVVVKMAQKMEIPVDEILK